jgi:hypothetical protein
VVPPVTPTPEQTPAAAAAITYTFYQGMDSLGNDIQRMTASDLPAMKEWCTANPECKGFNSGGWAKKLMRPMRLWTRAYANSPANSTMGMYVKNDPSIVPPTYTFHRGKYSPGADGLEFKSEAYNHPYMSAVCAEDSECKGYSNYGKLIKTIKPPAEWTSPPEWNTGNPATDFRGMYVKN